MLIFAVLLHLGIGLLMGLAAFGMTMLAGCCAFLPPDICRPFVENLIRWLVSLFPPRFGSFPLVRAASK
jgi:hypothetical protein